MNTKSGTDPHILVGRAFALGEEAIEREDWPAVKVHILACPECQRRVRTVVHNPIMREVQKRAHPTEVELFVFRFAEKLPAEEGSDVEFSEVLLLENGKGVEVGAPTVKGASVKAKVLKRSIKPVKPCVMAVNQYAVHIE